ncbi:preprotein translocase subunit SecY [Candidatus Undinarchaeota archaeon]
MGVLDFLPKVSEPKRTLTFNEKMKWTAIILLLYYILAEVSLWGIDPTATDYFESLRAIMAGRFDSIITLGIGPIVMGSIVLQLLVGAKVMEFDQSTPEGRALFQGSQKLFVIAFIIFEAIVLVASGQIPADRALGGIVVPALIFQIMLGATLIMFMDEVVSKWGFGSGVGLFIAAGVCQQIFVGSFNWIPGHAGEAIPGAIPYALTAFRGGQGFMDVFVRTGAGDLLAIVSTIIVLVVSIYSQAMKVELPLAYGNVRGIGRKFPLPFVYASNMPVIFTAALMANFQIWFGLLNKVGWMSRATMEKLTFYLLPHSNFGDLLVLHIAKGGGVLGMNNIIAASIYTFIMIIGSIIFAFLWVGMSNMDAKSLAERLTSSGMHRPGFRKDPRVTEKVLERFVPHITLLGGAFVGLLAAGATLTGAFGGGTGVLLTAGIVYKLYEDIASQQAMESQPLLKKFMGESSFGL